jgi:hypothetical protein
MEKVKYFRDARYSADVLMEAIKLFWSRSKTEGLLYIISVAVNDEIWSHEDLNEFMADYRKAGKGDFTIDIMKEPYRLRISEGTRVMVKAPTRGLIQEVFGIFESNYESSVIPVPPAPVVDPVIFIGHGRSPQWRYLKDHLQDKHGYTVTAYEVGARAGHSIRDIFEDMATRSSLAFLVHTKEDEQIDHTFHPRLNVVNETGLFQGRLGFSRAIALIEDGVEPFSNLQGIDQIRYINIKKTFGEVLATIKRELED